MIIYHYWQNWMVAYLGYTLRMKTLFRGWPVMAHKTHMRRRLLFISEFLNSQHIIQNNLSEMPSSNNTEHQCCHGPWVNLGIAKKMFWELSWEILKKILNSDLGKTTARLRKSLRTYENRAPGLDLLICLVSVAAMDCCSTPLSNWLGYRNRVRSVNILLPTVLESLC